MTQELSGFENHVSLVEHTADIGIFVRGRTLEELFEYAGFGMSSLLTGGLPKPKTGETRDISVDGPDKEDVLVNFLAEILYLFEGENFVVTGFSGSKYESESFTTTATGEIVDPPSLENGTGIKAVTYHKMNIQFRDNEWSTVIIFDV